MRKVLQYTAALATLAALSACVVGEELGDGDIESAEQALVDERLEGGTFYASTYDSPASERIEKAFDEDVGTKWLIFAGQGFLQYDSPNNEAYVLGSYSISSANDYPERDPRAWRLLGSNDGLTWTALDTRSNESFSARFQTKSYTVSGAQAYRKFRLEIQQNFGGWGEIQLSELALYGSPGTPVLPPPPVITASGENAPQETAARAFDGRPISKWLTSSSTGWIRYELPTAFTIDGYAITSANNLPARDPKSWTLQGSNDGVAWTTLDTRAGQSFRNRFQRNHYFINNTTAYKKYRFNFTSDTSVLHLSEIELLRTDDPYRAVLPQTVQYRNLSATPGGQRFNDAVGSAFERDVREISREVIEGLYTQPGAFWKRRNTLYVDVVDGTGAAWTSYSGDVATVGFNAYWINERYTNGDDVRHVILGVLYHELAHVYQLDDVGTGNGYIIEGLADSMRLRAGHHDLTVRTAGNFVQNDGEMATFLLWIEQFKKPGFIPAFNRSLAPYDALPYDESVFVTETGQTRAALWNEFRDHYWWGVDFPGPGSP
ncbi:basic secretory protein-like protein [Sorangium sp. So ce321]|uniref:basic secretory protein-like protein n=1 Tax=Sorangium sp. So ce321 TaxID=3133300 RepID=UPI003F622000